MPYMLSPSTIKLATDCPRCFWLQFNKSIKRPDSIFPSLPNGMDRVLKVHFDNYAEKDELPPEIADLNDVKVFKDKATLAKWQNYRQGLVYRDEEGNILKGAVDAILQKGNKLIVLDYKTRGYAPKADTHTYYIDQMNFYNYLLQKNGYETEDYAYLVFYHPDKVIENVFKFESNIVKIDTDPEVAEKTWKNALQLLKSPMPQASSTCSYCAYRSKSIPSTLLDF